MDHVKYIDYSKIMNTKTFRVFVQDYYSQRVPAYLTGIKPAPAMLNGIPVTAEEYNSHPGITEFADDEMVRHAPIQVGSEFDMTISHVTCAAIVDMCTNDIEFSIPNLQDLQEMLDIMYGYKQQISPFHDRQIVQAYLNQLNQALLILENNRNQRETRQERIDCINGVDKPDQTLAEMLKRCF